MDIYSGCLDLAGYSLPSLICYCHGVSIDCHASVKLKVLAAEGRGCLWR